VPQTSELDTRFAAKPWMGPPLAIRQ
jgi:hypothetical protein